MQLWSSIGFSNISIVYSGNSILDIYPTICIKKPSYNIYINIAVPNWPSYIIDYLPKILFSNLCLFCIASSLTRSLTSHLSLSRLNVILMEWLGLSFADFPALLATNHSGDSMCTRILYFWCNYCCWWYICICWDKYSDSQIKIYDYQIKYKYGNNQDGLFFHQY